MNFKFYIRYFYKPLSFLFMFLIGLLNWDFLARIFGLNQGTNQQIAINIFSSLVWLSLAWTVSRFFDIILWYSLFEKKLKIRIPGVLKDLFRIFIFFITIMGIVAFVFEKSVGGLLAASGLVSLVVGLSTKNLISDLFSGLVLNFDKTFSLGDLILVSGIYDTPVVSKEITWRCSYFETENKSLLIVPNSKVSTCHITNLSRTPFLSHSQVFSLPIYVPVERGINLLESAVRATPGLELPKDMVDIAVRSVSNNSINYGFTVFFQREKYNADQIKHLILKNILHVLNQADIEPALPVETVLHKSVSREKNQGENRLERMFRRVELFRTFTDEDIKEILTEINSLTFFPGDTVVEYQNVGDSLFILAEGLLEVFISVGEKQDFIPVARLVAGQYFGERSLLTGDPRSARIKAVTESVVYEITKDHLAPFMHKKPELAEIFARIIAERENANMEKKNKHLSDQEKKEIHESLFASVVSKIRNFFSLKQVKH